MADPPLDQVVSRTFEAGVRGQFVTDNGARIDWSVAPFLTMNEDDILFVSSGSLIGSGFFQNAGNTQRVGIEAGIEGATSLFSWFLRYAYVDASFSDELRILSEHNPAANENGEIVINDGDRLPGIPLHSAKIGAQYAVTTDWTINLSAITASSRVFRGDEGNDQDEVPGFAIANLVTTYAVTPQFDVFLHVENLSMPSTKPSAHLRMRPRCRCVSFLTVLLIRASLVRRPPAAYGSVPEFACDFKGRMLLADASPVMVFALLTANTTLFTRDNATLVARLEAAALKRQERRLSRLAAAVPSLIIATSWNARVIYSGYTKHFGRCIPRTPRWCQGWMTYQNDAFGGHSHFSS